MNIIGMVTILHGDIIEINVRKKVLDSGIRRVLRDGVDHLGSLRCWRLYEIVQEFGGVRHSVGGLSPGFSRHVFGSLWP